MKVRKGKITDIPQLIKLYSNVKEIADFAGQKYDTGYFTLFIKSKDNVMLVAEDDGRVCGALNAEFADMAKYVFLNNIVVSKECRGKGVSRLLMKSLEKLAKQRGNKRILVLVYDWNKNMQNIMKHYKYISGGKTIIYSKKL